mmetsp:Transcript_7566/g.9114  ORF Transcript_7566/g.9114 Transcript_7566/m.9114 type:complete len:299 (-) Transcript_7566:63-959(-)
MGVRQVLSKVCLFALVGFHIFHGAVLLENDTMFDKEVDGVGYVGDEYAVWYISLQGRISGLTEILFGLAAFAMGDSKMCFALLAIASHSSLIAVNRDVQELLALNELRNREHFEVVGHATLGIWLVNFLGFVCAGGKNKNENLVRSKSGFVNHILILSLLVEVLVWSYVQVDVLGRLAQIQPSLDPSAFFESFSNVGSVMLRLHTSELATGLCVLPAFGIALKPTWVGVTLSMLLHTGITGIIFMFKQQCESNVKDAQKLANANAFAEQAIIFHAVVALLLLICLFIDGMSKSKTKKE